MRDENAIDTSASDTEAFLNCLIENTDRGTLPALAKLITTISWSNADNGHAIEQVRRAWLRRGSQAQVALALSLTETYPGDNRETLVANVLAAARRFPELAALAHAFIERWDTQMEPRRKVLSTSLEARRTPDVEVTATPPTAARTMTIPQAAAFIARHPAANAPPVFFSEILDEWLMCLPPKARPELFAVRDAWLTGKDEWLAAVAAWMSVVAPTETVTMLKTRKATATRAFARIAVADDASKWFTRAK